MPKLKTNAQVAFLKGISEMTARFRQDIDAHFALIGKATASLLAAGEPATAERLIAQIEAMTNDRNRPVAERAIKQIRHRGLAG